MGILPVISGFQAYDDARTKTGDPNDNSLTGNAGKAFCRAWNSKPNRYLQPLIGSTTNPALLRAPNEFCRPYNENQGIDPPSSQLPFTGGQCVGVGYTVRLNNMRWYQGSSPPYTEQTVAQVNINVTGPVRAIQWYGEGLTNAPSRTYTGVEILHGNNQRTTYTGNAIAGRWFSRGGDTVVRSNGAADTCGNPPPVIVPSPDAPDIDFGDDQTFNVGGSPTTINVGAPLLDIDNEIYVPITINGDEFVFSPTADPPNLPQDPQPPTVEGPPVDVPGGGGAVDDDGSGEDEGRELIGYRWEFTNAPLSRGWIVNTSPRVSPRVFGNIRLKLEGQSGTFWGTNVEIDSVQGFVARPSDFLKVKGVVLQSEASYNQSRLTPVYAIRGTNGRQ